MGDGKSQRDGIDCNETFSPVVKPTCIRVVLSIALAKSWTTHQLDVKNEFLHGHLNETAYMHQLMGFHDHIHPDYIYQLQKSLYGLKQAPRAWYRHFANFVTTIDFRNKIFDNSLFIYSNDYDVAYLLLYVDDIILTASSDAFQLSIIAKLSAEFSMKDLRSSSYFLGITVTHNA